MSLRIHNTLTRAKESFVPLEASGVTMYVCGITPYDRCHIGHARSAIVFDVVRRYLAHRGFPVRYVKNYTDVEDKIIRRAREEGVAPEALADRYIRAYQEDMQALGVTPADVEPRATDHIVPAAGRPYRMVSLIERLVARGTAYAVDGDVYFEVSRFPAYGRLSGKPLDELLAGARVEVDERKRDPRDFALWKAAKPGEPSWPSPWGPGRPGWHIECSAMAMEHLGETVDLHGGGQDLVFPHHECEVAQSEAATGRPFARVWIHNAFVNLGAEKMSKSLGNTLAIGDLVARHEPDALRLYLLGTHYRNPIDFAEGRIPGLARSLDNRFRRLLSRVPPEALVGPAGEVRPDESTASPDELDLATAAAREHFETAMDDDFHTPGALDALFRLADGLHARLRRDPGGEGSFVRAARTLLRLGRVLGLLQQHPKTWHAVGQPVAGLAGASPAHLAASGMAPGSMALYEKIGDLVAAREEARKQRDWDRADALRAEILAQGFIVEDTAAGPVWRQKKR